jgi:hypothetical protein
MLLPAAQDLARFMGIPRLKPTNRDGTPTARRLAPMACIDRTPLWYYILKEA